MKAVRIHQLGGPEVLTYEDVADPKPRKDQVVATNQKPRVITPGLLALNQWLLNYTACQTTSIIGSAEPDVKLTSVSSERRAAKSNRSG